MGWLTHFSLQTPLYCECLHFPKNYISQDSLGGQMQAHDLDVTHQMCAQGISGRGSQHIRGKFQLLTSRILQGGCSKVSIPFLRSL